MREKPHTAREFMEKPCMGSDSRKLMFCIAKSWHITFGLMKR
jgi:hypothetical protein